MDSPLELQGLGQEPRGPGIQSSVEMGPYHSCAMGSRTLDSWGCAPGAGCMVWFEEMLEQGHREVE